MVGHRLIVASPANLQRSGIFRKSEVALPAFSTAVLILRLLASAPILFFFFFRSFIATLSSSDCVCTLLLHYSASEIMTLSCFESHLLHCAMCSMVIVPELKGQMMEFTTPTIPYYFHILHSSIFSIYLPSVVLHIFFSFSHGHVN
jgi:hypothetical protein